jgi:hypothetical protein
MALHGRARDLRGRGQNRVHTKGISACNDFLVELDLDGSTSENKINECLIKWFSICHGISGFPSGEEPSPGTFDCPFCGLSLDTVHHAHEHTHACARDDAEKRAQQLLDTYTLIDQPCRYQRCGIKENLGEFVTCGETFTSEKDRGEHMREHVRSMMKKDDDGNKVPTCFFRDCASNPKGGRLNRDGPDFASTDDDLPTSGQRITFRLSRCFSFNFKDV